jgi:hypothetical protein
VPFWEVAQCEQAPVVTWDLLGDALSPLLIQPLRSLGTNEARFEGRQNNSVGTAVKRTKIPKRVRPQLLAETEFLDHSLIAIGIVGFQIVEQATPLADQHEKTAARAMVLLVHLEVFRQ